MSEIDTYENFQGVGKPLHNRNGCMVLQGEDNTVIKHVSEPRYFIRLKNEYNCLTKIGDKPYVPKLVAYNEEQHNLRMEFISGLTIPSYVGKFGEIPKHYMKNIVLALIGMLECGVEYGADMKYTDHIIIENNTKEIRFIDFGISDIIDRDDLITFWKKNYKIEYAFVFKDTKDDEDSKETFIENMLSLGIKQEVIDKYLLEMDHITQL